MKKKLMLLLSLVLCMAFVVGCAKTSNDEEATLTDDAKRIIETNMTQNFETWVGFDFASIYEDKQYDKETRAQYKTWAELRDKLGDMTSQTEPSLGKPVLNEDTEQYNLTATMYGEFTKGKIKFTMQFDMNGTVVSRTTVQVQEVEPKSELMSKALLNTLMGMGTVFVILILISLVISCFGLINKQQAKKNAAQKENQPVSVAPAAMAPVETEPEDVTDDLELVAVITAAIMASMGEEAPAEGLVVRSIKKRNASKWKNA